MKKIISLLAALACISAFSCNSKTADKNDSAPSSQSITAEKLSLRSAPIALGDELESITVIDRMGENVLIFGTDDRGGYTGYVTDCGFEDQRSFRIIPAECENVLTACMCKFGKASVLTVMDGTMYLYIYNKDGDLFKTLNFGRSVIPDDVTPILMANDEDFIISIKNEHFIAYSANGDALGELDLGGRVVYGFSKDSEGIPTLLLSDSGGTSTAQITGTELTNITACNTLASSAYAMCGGNEEYSLFARFTEGLYGLKEGQWVQLSDLSDCGIMAMDVWGLLNLGGNDFAALTIAAGRTGLYMLSERDISEVSTKKTVKIGMFGTDEVLMTPINRYNAESENYRAEIKSYVSGTEAYNRDEMLSRLRLDIISGDAPDLLVYYFPELNADSFMDMFELIDKDPEISREDFIPNILDSMAINGRLSVLAPNFTVNSLITKKKLTGARENWSFDDVIEAYNSLPEGVQLCYDENLRDHIDNFHELIPIREFVDYENGVCTFDSPEFIKLIKLFRDRPIGISEEEYFQNGYESTYDPLAFEEDRLMSQASDISSIREIWRHMRCSEDELVITGKPTMSGKGSCAVPCNYQLSIPLNAQNPDGAWDMVKYFTIDYFGSHSYSYSSMPIYQTCFDRNRLKCLVNEPGNEDLVYFGDGQDITEVHYTNAEQTEYEVIAPLTEDELEEYTEFIYDAAKNFTREDEVLWYTIVRDELLGFFAGEVTAEQAAERIQNRASIYLSERF